MAKLAIITGASSGLGAEMARQLARRGGWHLLLAARRTDRLDSLAKEIGSPTTSVDLLTTDLSTDFGVQALVERMSQYPASPELFINNAGFGAVGTFYKGSADREAEMVRLNCIALLRLMHAVAPRMVAAKRGVIVNVASVAGFLPLPYMSTYAATKAFVLSLSLATNEELKGAGVTVLALCPGPTESEFHLAAGLAEKLDVFPAMTAERVVEQLLTGVDHKRRLVVNGLMNTLSTRLCSLVGPRVAATLAAPIMRSYLRGRGVSTDTK